ncbi:MAG: AMP-binding protein [Deltaproteobacteria bacterium]|nr:AMP-binding protein [Deltaproteobacteria bacterium]
MTQYRKIEFPEPVIDVTRLQDGTCLLKSPLALDDYRPTLLHYLVEHANRQPDAAFLAQRDQKGEWQYLNFREAEQQISQVCRSLAGRHITSDRPVMLLSGSSIDHALFRLGAMAAGIPAVPVSPGYSLMSTDYAKLKYVFNLIDPGMVFVEDGEQFAKALHALDLKDTELVVSRPGKIDIAHTPMGTLGSGGNEDKLGPVLDQIDPDQPATLMFTSGSTGMPKAVIHTHRMICSATVMTRQIINADGQPVAGLQKRSRSVSWLPWHHVSGTSALYSTIILGGTLYIDKGKPVPGLFDETLRNLKEISSSFYVNVPVGYRMLVEALESDPQLRRTFFKDLHLLIYGAASLPADVYDRIEALAVEEIGERIMFISAYGSTETTNSITYTYFECDPTGFLGLPVPGIEIKLVPCTDAYELLVRGPNITPGYYRQDELKSEIFDSEGFFRTGDLVTWADPEDYNKGLAFAGRVAEEFKLITGTWVSGGNIRTNVIDVVSPLIGEAVVCGLDRSCIAVMAWLNRAECRATETGFDPDAPGDSAVIVKRIESHIREYNGKNKGSSLRIARMMLMTTPLSSDAGELSDKGSVNQRAVWRNREADVERLYAETPEAGVLCF